MKLSKDLKAALEAKGGPPVTEGKITLDIASGKLDEVTYSYNGEEPLVFGVHLRCIQFDKTNGNIIKLESLTKVSKLLGDDEHYRLLELKK